LIEALGQPCPEEELKDEQHIRWDLINVNDGVGRIDVRTYCEKVRLKSAETKGP
jgi:hypothetical protein